MNDNMPQNIAQTILDQAASEADRRTRTLSAHDSSLVEVLIARQGTTATVIQGELDKFAAIPRFRAGKIEAHDLDSFAALVLRDHDAGSMIFADVSGPGVRFEAVLDANLPMNGEACFVGMTGKHAQRDGQRHGREVIAYSPALSDEWTAWTSRSGKAMSQGEFAEWIDEHLPDLADPAHLKADNQAESTAAKFGARYGGTKEVGYGFADPERMVKLSTGLVIREKSTFKSASNLSSGEMRLEFESTHEGEDGKPLDVPRRFLLSIPVFKREAAYLVPVKLAYRKKGPMIEWSFDLFRPDRFRDDAIEGMRSDLAGKLTPKDGAGPVVPIVLGKRG